MLLVLDVGNTETLVGVYEGGSLVKTTRFETHSELIAGTWRSPLKDFLTNTAITHVAASNVVPSAEKALAELALDFNTGPAFLIDHNTPMPIRLMVDQPQRVGADLIANAAAAFKKFPQNTVVVDMGTATTFQIITKDGDHTGGAFFPGLKISYQALFEKAEKLSDTALEKPQNITGTNTQDCLQSGIYHGYRHMVIGMCSELEKDFGEPLQVIITGGIAELFKEDWPQGYIYDPYLTIEGVRLLFEGSL